MIKNKRGIALILSFIVIVILTILSIGIVSRSISENQVAKKNAESAQAFWLAEAGVNRGLNELRNAYDTSGTGLLLTGLGPGEYKVDVAINGQTRTVTGHGFIPSAASPRVERVIQAVMQKTNPTNFYNNAVYAAGNVSSKNNAYKITGDVIYAGTISTKAGNTTGTITHDTTIKPLAQLDYNYLRTLSKSQNNYHDSNHLSGPFPSSFWYNQNAGIPNVVFLEGSLSLNSKNIGGFYVLAQNGNATYDATLGGNFSVNGCIYTQGNVTLNGGGSQDLNLNGGIWSGKNTTLDGGVTVAYNTAYMNAIAALNIVMVVQIGSWRDTQDPYSLTHQ